MEKLGSKGGNMNVKQIKWHAAVLAVTIFAALTVLFAMATVTSNAADAVYDETTRTYTMSDSTYDQQIVLEDGTTTTIDISGYNMLTYGTSYYYSECISGTGNLKIIGSGTLVVPNGMISCTDLTIGDGVKLIISKPIYTNGNITMGNAEIEPGSQNAYMYCYNSSSPKAIVFNNTTLKINMNLYGPSALNDCNVTFKNASLYSNSGECTINGGTYNFIRDNVDQNSYNSSMSIAYRTIVKNAVIKSNAGVAIQNLEMSDSTLEITIPTMMASTSYYGHQASLIGDNLVFVGSKVKIDGNVSEGIFVLQRLIMTGNTEVDIKALETGIVGNTVEITHSSGKIQATDPDQKIAAIEAIESGYGSNITPKSLTLNKLYVKEPAGGTVGEATVRPSTGQPGDEISIKTILDGEVPATTVVLEADHTTHIWDAGKVTKEPTETAEGVKTYTCTVCGATRTEAIPKLTPQDSQGSQTPATGADGTPFGKGASVAAAEAAILALPNDNDPAGTAFGLLQLKATKVTKNSINLKWKAVPGATKYILFANKCGTGNKYKKLIEVTGTSLNVTQAAGAALQKGTYYKFMMIAADANGKVITTSKTVHAATKGGKVGNHKKVTVKKTVTKKARKLKKGKTLKLKAKAIPQSRKLKVRKHRGIKYETSNLAVAKVNGKGTVKGIGKGTCYIYAYAQNGTCAKVKVTVK